MIQTVKQNVLQLLHAPDMLPEKPEKNALLTAMQKDGRFSDLDYTVDDEGNWSFGSHLARLARLAADESFLAQPNHLQAVLRGVDFFLQAPRRNPNWWFNDIGLPRSAGRICLLLAERLTPAQTSGLMQYVSACRVENRSSYPAWHGANLLWGVMNTVVLAVLTNDETLLRATIDTARTELVVQPDGQDGMQLDHSYLFHHAQLYTCGYGRAFAADCAALIFILKQTEWQFSQEELTVLAKFIFSGIRYCVRNKHVDYLTFGREIVRPDALSANGIRHTLLLLQQVPEMPCRDVMQEQLASFSAEGYALHGDKFFYNSGYYVSRTIKSHIGCRVTQPDMMLGESINGENALSANLCAGGATCIMVDGREYENIFPLWDFAHVPGTTAPIETDEQLLARLPEWHGRFAHNAYAGGISRNKYGIAYQDLDFGGVTGVTARFFVEGMMIALGAGITSQSGRRVTTTLNQCWQTGPIAAQADGLPAGCACQGRVLYASLDDQPLVIESAEKQANWSRIFKGLNRQAAGKVCTFYIDHGVDPQNAAYAYLVAPAVANEHAAAKMADVRRNLVVLQNDPFIQAIRYKEHVYCVFHKPRKLSLFKGNVAFAAFDIPIYDRICSSAPSAHIINNVDLERAPVQNV